MHKPHKIDYPIHDKFWCHECDGKVVDSDDKSTGQFYEATGHVLEKDFKTTGAWKTVIYAVCSDCDK